MKKTLFLKRLVCVVLTSQTFLDTKVFILAEKNEATSETSSEVLTQSFSDSVGLSLEGKWESPMETSRDTMVNNYESATSESELDSSITSTSELSEIVIASGTYGTVFWQILATGVLVLEAGDFPDIPASDYNQYVSPWAAYEADITRVEINGHISVSPYGAEGLFIGLTNLREINQLNRLDFSQALSIA